MNRNLILAVSLALALLAGGGLYAQDRNSSSKGGDQADTLIYVKASPVDASLAGKNIFNELPLRSKGGRADVRVHQSESIATAMNNYIETNAKRPISGFRVRIFFDNKQNSRYASEAALERFNAKYHDIPAYRSYTNPYFKVTVGDFRTRSEAMQLLERIRDDFPTAFIVKENNINYPLSVWRD